MGLGISSPVAVVLDTSNVTSYATASFTPTANSLLVVFVMANATIATGSLSNSGTALTWNLANRTQGAIDTQWIWTAQCGASPGAMVITFDCTGDASTGAYIRVLQVTGHDTANPVVQAIQVSNSTNSANPSITLSQAMNTNNLYIAQFNNNTNPFNGAPATNWTELDDTGFATPTTGLHTSYRIGGETGSSVTITATSSIWKSAFIEIAVAPSGFSISSPVAALASTTNATSYATASFTPAANSLLIVMVMAYDTLATGSISGGSLTWALLARNEIAVAFPPTQFIWYAQVGDSPSSMTITFDCTGDTSSGVFISTWQVIGHNQGNPIAQFLGGATVAGPSTHTYTLDQSMNTNNAYCYMITNANGLTATPPSGWTETSEVSFATPSVNMEAAMRTGGETGNTLSVVYGSANTTQFAFVEINVAPVVSIKRMPLLGVG